MPKKPHCEFSLNRLVTFVAALWLVVTVLLILCCTLSAKASKPKNYVNMLHQEALNFIQKVVPTAATNSERGWKGEKGI